MRVFRGGAFRTPAGAAPRGPHGGLATKPFSITWNVATTQNGTAYVATLERTTSNPRAHPPVWCAPVHGMVDAL